MSSATSGKASLAAIARHVEARKPGWRTEIVQGGLIVSPLRDGPHLEAVAEVMLVCATAGLHGGASRVIQGIGLCLPEEPEDYAVPDLSVVNADYREHLVRGNCYASDCFRLVADVVSDELNSKADAYALAKIPVYVVVDRENQALHVLTDPAEDGYAHHRVHAPGEIVTLPDSIGANVSLDVQRILKAGQPSVS
ncbi:Uma2 family endonuclease [Streptomyces spinoverrucosus]|uniref:Uma2 family endonuclease n=1 Tax=Streptomyces spinoverrucosus TaxID=284043 RepID=UPI0018C35893|nr:Uma2 family endonuclease [Streptomyces spinoverrucosus]MBG0853008.1 Uma2 family endonuclease [Streptomyces spinoverrucosus]